MEKNMGLLIGLVILSALLSLILIFVVAGNQVDEEAFSKSVTAQVLEGIPTPEPVVVPTAKEIAAEIVLPKFDVPEFKSDSKVLDLWENMYSDEIEELEAEAYDVAEIELEDHDYELLTEWLEANVEGFYELEDVDVEDYEINIIELGLEEDEDKSAEVVLELEVYYSLKEGPVNDLEVKKLVITTASVSFDEGDFNDEDVKLVFA